MNIHNNENDPFEGAFRDRFAEFESEPDTQLWQKIEPQLPVNPTRKFPYWQTSAVIIILLLVGLWNYRETHSVDSQVVNKPKSNDGRTVNRVTEVIPTQNTENKNLIVIDLSKNTTEKTTTKSEENIYITEPLNRSLRKENKSFLYEKSDNKVVMSNKNKNSTLFSTLNTTIDVPKTSINKIIDNNFSENENIVLNLSLLDNSNEKRQKVINPNDLSNSQAILSVSSDDKQVAVLNTNYLTLIDSKSFNLLRNNFKTPKLKFVIAPKKDDYFKESKPIDLYVSVMPLLNYYTITPNGNDANYVHSIAVNNDDDRLGFYTQGGLIFTLSDKFKLRTGLTFTRTNHNINYQIRTDSLIVQSLDKQGVDVSFEEKKATYSQIANYLGTKIEIQYILLAGEALSHYVNVGLEGSYRLNGVKEFNGFANFAYGITRQVGDNAYLFIEPTFSYSLNQQSDNSSLLLVKPNKIGFNIGVNFKIK